MDSIQDIADRLDRAADRCHNAADFQAEHDARNAATQARRAASVMQAQQIEQAFMSAHLSTMPGAAPAYQDLAQNQGCLSGWFSARSNAGSWRATTASPYRSWSVFPYFSSPGYRHYTVYNAVSRHLPPGYSDPNAYAQQLYTQTGIDPNSAIGDLTPAQLATLTSAIDANPNWSQNDSLPDIATGARSTSNRDDNAQQFSSADASAGQDFESRSDDASGGSDASSGADFASAPSDNS
jgi:hypothetical protein